MAVIFDMQPAANLKLLVFELAVPAQAGGGVLKPVNEGKPSLWFGWLVKQYHGR